MSVTDASRQPRCPQGIWSTKLLVVEGYDAFRFAKALLRSLDLLAQIQVENYGGVAELAAYLRTLPVVSGWATVASLGVLRDAEAQGADSAFASVCSGLDQAGLSVPDRPIVRAGEGPGVSVFILPDCSSRGSLETLLLQTVTDDSAAPCVAEYFECLQARDMTIPRNREKAQVQAFLASRPEYVAHLGEAADKGYFPWESPKLAQLKEFLRGL